jgi:glycosyltransferase involved in cell wall biosynthesis
MKKAATTDGGSNPALLVVAPFVPDFDRLAGSLRFFTMLRILSREYRIVFLGGIKPGGQRHVAALESLGVDVHDATSTTVPTLLPEVEAGVFFEFYHSAEDIIDTVRRQRSDLPIVVDSVDLHFVRESRAVAYAEQPDVAGRRALDTRRRELEVYRKADAIIVVTEDDKQTLLNLLPNTRVAVVPTIHEVSDQVPAFSDRTRNSVLFVGGFEHSPNVDAVLFFCRDILPLIRRSVPDITVTIVGDAAPKAIRDLGSEVVKIAGWVPDVKPYLNNHRVSIAPLRFGSGMKGKVAEAMANGLPVVVTTVAAEGMELSDGVTALIADSPEDFAKAVTRLLTDPALHERLSTNSRRMVSTRWSEAVAAPRLLGLIRTLSDVRPKRASVRKRLRWTVGRLLRRLGFDRRR